MKLKLAALALLAATVSVASAQAPAAAAPAGSDDLRKTLVTTASSLFTAYQQMDQQLFLSIISSDFLYVSKTGIMTAEELGGSVQGCSLSAFKISDPQVHKLSPDSAVLVYKLHQTAACNGKPEPTDLFVTDTFVRHGNDWLMSVHAQTAAL